MSDPLLSLADQRLVLFGSGQRDVVEPPALHRDGTAADAYDLGRYGVYGTSTPLVDQARTGASATDHTPFDAPDCSLAQACPSRAGMGVWSFSRSSPFLADDYLQMSLDGGHLRHVVGLGDTCTSNVLRRVGKPLVGVASPRTSGSEPCPSSEHTPSRAAERKGTASSRCSSSRRRGRPESLQVPTRRGEQRSTGDPPELVASNAKIRRELGWSSRRYATATLSSPLGRDGMELSRFMAVHP